jgi:hypothetical protein
MSTFTNTLVSPAYDTKVATRAKAAAPAEPKQRLFARLFQRMIEARQRQAERELHRHGLHLPSELEAAGRKISARNEDSLPFVR